MIESQISVKCMNISLNTEYWCGWQDRCKPFLTVIIFFATSVFCIPRLSTKNAAFIKAGEVPCYFLRELHQSQSFYLLPIVRNFTYPA